MHIRKALSLLLAILFLCGGISFAQETSALPALRFEEEIAVITPGKASFLQVRADDYAAFHTPFTLTIRLEDGTVVGSKEVRGVKTSVSITLPEGLAPRTTLYAFRNEETEPAASFDVAVVDRNYSERERNAERSDKMIALTFDCAFGEFNTDFLLDTLQKYGIHCTFFMTGQWVTGHADPWIKRMIADGHEIGSHSFLHRDYLTLSPEQVVKDIAACEQIMAEKLDGYRPKLIRPPYGHSNYGRDAIMRYMGYEIILWGVASSDSGNLPADDIIRQVMAHVKPGEIILCHNDALQLKNYLVPLIELLLKEGYTFGTVSELLALE